MGWPQRQIVRLSKIVLFSHFSPLFEIARERAVIIVEFRLSALSFSAQQSFEEFFEEQTWGLGWE